MLTTSQRLEIESNRFSSLSIAVCFRHNGAKSIDINRSTCLLSQELQSHKRSVNRSEDSLKRLLTSLNSHY